MSSSFPDDLTSASEKNSDSDFDGSTALATLTLAVQKEPES